MKTKIIIACFFMCIFDYSMKAQDAINKHMCSAARVSLIISSPYHSKDVFYLVKDSSIIHYSFISLEGYSWLYSNISLAENDVIDIRSINIGANKLSINTAFPGAALGIPAGIVIGTDQSAKNPSYLFDDNWVPAAGAEIPGGEIDARTGEIIRSFGIRIPLRGKMDK